MKPVLELEHVNKAFGGVIAASDVTFSVMPGEIHGLIGPNGAGKTTMMNIISGIYKADSGKIFLSSKDVTEMPAHRRSVKGIGRTFQSPRLLKGANIRDNLLVGTDVAQDMGYVKSFFSRRDRAFEKELEEYMEIAGFSIDLEDDISKLTFGQRKILEIIRSLLAKPKIMLVDEPAAGLNENEGENAMALLRLVAGKGIAVLFIEHAMHLVMNTCHQIEVLNFGKIIASGTPQEVSNNKEVIAAYLGRADDD